MKLRIIFVDDEPNIIQGLKRSLFTMRREWDMFFSVGGHEALDIMAENEIDVIVTDMRMPEMDGAELLEQVRELYPRVIRIILSGYSEQKMILHSVNVAHQFLIKPCNIETLKDTIKRILGFRSALNNEYLIKIVTWIDSLPSMPRLYQILAKEVKSPDVSLKKVGAIISQDLSMTTRVLQLVNSAFFSLPQKITDPYQAITLIGTDNLKAMILFTHLFSILEAKASSHPLIRDLWQHSILAANLAKKIVQSEWNDQQLAQEAFSAGMLHDIGKLILLQVDDYRDMVKDWTNQNWHYCSAKEYEKLGTSHAEVGAYLLGLWGINESIVEPVAFHHYPSGVKGKGTAVIIAVHAANGLVASASFSDIAAGNSNIDVEFLESVQMMDRLPGWIDIYHQLIKGEFEHE